MSDDEIVMSRERSRQGALASELEKQLKMSFAAMLESNVHAIAGELLKASDGKGGVGFRFGLGLSDEAVTLDGKVSWSRKFEDKDERVFKFADPMRPELPGLDKKGGE